MKNGFLKLGGLALGLILSTTVLAAGNSELAHEKITLWSDGARLQGDIFKPAGLAADEKLPVVVEVGLSDFFVSCAATLDTRKARPRPRIRTNFMQL